MEQGIQSRLLPSYTLCSLSLSPDSLLDYTGKDMQESTFEKLRLKFVTKRNQHKRQREEIQEKERDKISPVKRAKTSDLPVKEQDIKSETLNTAQPDEDKTKVKEEDKTVDHVDEVDDMRLIIHNLGKFLSHRDVQLMYLMHPELVQSALLDSNTSRDDRILYNKLVRMSGI